MVLDVNAQQQIWRQSHGLVDFFGLNFGLGQPGVGGPLATSTGLVFVDGGGESALRAYDIDTGDELWRHPLPFAGSATPMSYEVVDKRGVRKQLVVIAAGGDARAGTAVGDYLVAFALPD